MATLKPKNTRFIKLLRRMLLESSGVITWNLDGNAFSIPSLTAFEKELPLYFNHNRFNSFQRQLNYFGFRKWQVLFLNIIILYSTIDPDY